MFTEKSPKVASKTVLRLKGFLWAVIRGEMTKLCQGADLKGPVIPHSAASFVMNLSTYENHMYEDPWFLTLHSSSVLWSTPIGNPNSKN